MFDFKPTRTRSGLSVTSDTRRRLFRFGLSYALLSALPVAIAIFRAVHLHENPDAFFLWYLVALCSGPILWGIVCVRSGNSIFQSYVLKESPLGKFNELMKPFYFIVPTMATLYISGLPSLLLPFLPIVGTFVKSLIANAISLAISGIVGNYTYDLVKRWASRL